MFDKWWYYGGVVSEKLYSMAALDDRISQLLLGKIQHWSTRLHMLQLEVTLGPIHRA